MTIQGLLDLLPEFEVGGQLDAWELHSIRNLTMNDDGEMLFEVTIGHGPLLYRLGSYIPPKSVMADIIRRANSWHE